MEYFFKCQMYRIRQAETQAIHIWHYRPLQNDKLSLLKIISETKVG